MRRFTGILLASVALAASAGSPGQAQEQHSNDGKTLIAEASIELQKVPVPAGEAILGLFRKKAITAADIYAANTTAGQEIAKLQPIKTHLDVLHNAAVSCAADSSVDAPALAAIATKVHAFDGDLADIGAWLADAIANVAKKIDSTNVWEKDELRKFQRAYTAYNRLRVEAHALANSIADLAADIPRSVKSCQPVSITPFSEKYRGAGQRHPRTENQGSLPSGPDKLDAPSLPALKPDFPSTTGNSYDLGADKTPNYRSVPASPPSVNPPATEARAYEYDPEYCPYYQTYRAKRASPRKVGPALVKEAGQRLRPVGVPSLSRTTTAAQRW